MAFSQQEIDFFSKILGQPLDASIVNSNKFINPTILTLQGMSDESVKPTPPQELSQYYKQDPNNGWITIDPKTGKQITILQDPGYVIDRTNVQYDPNIGIYTDPTNIRYEGDGLDWLPFAMIAPAVLGAMGVGGAGAGGASGMDAAGWGGWAGGAEGGMTTAGIGFGAETIPGYASMSATQQAAFSGLVAQGVPTGAAMEAVMGAGAAGGAGGFLGSLGLGGAGSVGGALSGLGSIGGLASAGLGAIAGASGPKSGTTTTTSGPPEWLQTQLQGYLGNANQVAANSQYTPMNGYQTDALQGIASQAMAGSPANYAGQQQITDTLNGNYLNSNPYLDFNINKAQNDLVQQYQLGTAAQTDASAARAHALGGSSYNQLTAYNNNVLANNLNNVDASMRGANYSNERSNQMQALSQTPNMVNTGYADWNNLYNAGNALQQQQQQQAQWPEHQLGIQDNAMKTALGGAGTVQSQPWQANTTAGLLGGAATGLSLWNAWK